VVTRKRDRVADAKRRVLRDLIEQLERSRSMSSIDEINAIDALLIELRRRAGVEPLAVPPGQEHLPGMGLFVITFLPEEATHA
jgi:hypothetical protein